MASTREPPGAGTRSRLGHDEQRPTPGCMSKRATSAVTSDPAGGRRRGRQRDQSVAETSLEDQQLSERALRDVARCCTAVDARMADLFEQGASECLYFVRAKVPRIVDNDGHTTHRVRERFKPIASPVQTELGRLVRERLRPAPGPSLSPAERPGKPARAARGDNPQSPLKRRRPRALSTGDLIGMAPTWSTRRVPQRFVVWVRSAHSVGARRRQSDASHQSPISGCACVALARVGRRSAGARPIQDVADREVLHARCQPSLCRTTLSS